MVWQDQQDSTMNRTYLGRDPAGPLAPLGAPNPLLQHTVILVITDVHLRDATNGMLNDRDKVREPFFEVFDLVDTVLAFNVITKIDVWQVFVLLKHSG